MLGLMIHRIESLFRRIKCLIGRRLVSKSSNEIGQKLGRVYLNKYISKLEVQAIRGSNTSVCMNVLPY